MKCNAGDTILLSNPPQCRCVYCGKYWIAGNTVPDCFYVSSDDAVKDSLKEYIEKKQQSEKQREKHLRDTTKTIDGKYYTQLKRECCGKCLEEFIDNCECCCHKPSHMCDRDTWECEHCKPSHYPTKTNEAPESASFASVNSSLNNTTKKLEIELLEDINNLLWEYRDSGDKSRIANVLERVDKIISHSVQEAKAEERGRIIAEIEKFKKVDNDCQHGPSDSCDSNCTYQHEHQDYNQIISDVLGKI